MTTNTNFLEKLLDGAEVEWKKLGEVCGLITTGKLNANAMEDGGDYPFFTCNEKPYKINSYAFDLEAILISGNGSQVGHLNYFKGKFNAYQRTYIIGNFRDVYAMYLFHYLSHTLKSYIFQNSKKGSIPYITMPMLENFLIPIPCPSNPKRSLEIQAEIVRILDKFTELTTELTAELTTELTARKKQYAYYRDQLLTFKEGEVEWKALKDVIHSLKTGLNPRKNFQLNTEDSLCYYVTVREIQNGKIKFFEKTDRINEKALGLINGRSNLDAGDILFSGTGTVGRTAVINEKPKNWNIKEGVYVIKPIKYMILPKYLSHLLNSSDIVKEYAKKIVGNPVVSLPMSDLRNLIIPIPPLDKQARIVAILDKFDTLTNSITEGLPREIELRQKQYAYYRDMLLNFAKPVEAKA